MNHGLSAAAVARIHEIFTRHPEVERVILYGSRAKGNFRPGSDIDLTLVGDKLDPTIIARIDDELDDLLLPYRFDLSLFARITNSDLLEHIRRVGIALYEKTPVEAKR